jgi:SAM-dependent methyltransferase
MTTFVKIDRMPELAHSPEDLRQLYRARFEGAAEYRIQMWEVLARYFGQWIPADASVLDLGCGYCEFINQVRCQTKFGMDLNPDSVRFAESATILEQDCSQPWPLPVGSLDVVFTSNFFEHLPNKMTLENTLVQAFQSLKPGGRLIAMGPNVRYVPGAYWDFFDHYLALTEKSLAEVLTKVGFQVEHCFAKFMPYSAVGKRQYPIFMIKAYLALPSAWKIFGKQFFVIARKPA